MAKLETKMEVSQRSNGLRLIVKETYHDGQNYNTFFGVVIQRTDSV